MFSFNIGILHSLHKHHAKQRLKRCSRQQKKQSLYHQRWWRLLLRIFSKLNTAFTYLPSS